jgi:hypothetical protein
MISFCHGGDGDGGEILSWWRERERGGGGRREYVIENCRIE